MCVCVVSVCYSFHARNGMTFCGLRFRIVQSFSPHFLNHHHIPKPNVVLMNRGRCKLHVDVHFPTAGLPKNRWFVLSFRALAWMAFYFLPLHCVSFSNLRGYCVYGNAPGNSSLVCWRSFLDVVGRPHFWLLPKFLQGCLLRVGTSGHIIIPSRSRHCGQLPYFSIVRFKIPTCWEYLVGKQDIPSSWHSVRACARTALGPGETFEMAEQTGFSRGRVFVATVLLPSLYFLLYVAFVSVQLCLVPGRNL